MKKKHLLAIALSSLLITVTVHAKIERLMKVSPTFYRGAQPEGAVDFKALKSQGIKTVIDLRLSDEQDIPAEGKIVQNAGMNFKSYPIKQWTYPNDRQISAILKDLANPTLQPVFVHCHQGRDRTGMIAALYRVLTQHWTAQKAHDEWVKYGFIPEKFDGLEKFFWDHTK